MKLHEIDDLLKFDPITIEQDCIDAVYSSSNSGKVFLIQWKKQKKNKQITVLILWKSVKKLD